MPLVRSIVAPLHRRPLVRAIVELLTGRPGPHVLHAFGAWVDTAVAARDVLATRGVEARVVVTAWTPIEHEAAAKLDSQMVQDSRRLRLAGRLELAWVRRVTVPAERRGYRAADAVAVNYDSVIRLIEQAYGPGLPFHKLTYAPPTAFGEAELPGAAPTGLPPGEAPLLLSVGRQDGRKGQDRFLDALAILRDEGRAFRGCLVGGGTLLEAHRKRARELRLDDRVTLPGRVPEVMPYLRVCDVYVLPSTQEASGSVGALEAMQAGAAIVSTAIDGMPEDITDGQDGLLVEPGSAEAIAAALRRLLDAPDERVRLGAAARSLYERRFSANAAATELDTFYGTLLSSSSRTAVR